MRIFVAQKYLTTFFKLRILNLYTAWQFYLLLSFKYTIIVEVRNATCCLLRFNLKEFASNKIVGIYIRSIARI